MNIWTLDLVRECRHGSTVAQEGRRSPYVSDGTTIAFSSIRVRGTMAIYRKPLGKDERELVFTITRPFIRPPGLRTAGFCCSSRRISNCVRTSRRCQLHGDRCPIPYLATRFIRRGLCHHFHSDGQRWVAYTRQTSPDTAECYVQRFQDLHGKVQISNRAGVSALGSYDASMYFFRARTLMDRARSCCSNPLAWARPTPLFDTAGGLGKTGRGNP